jgi:hypothetical protein
LPVLGLVLVPESRSEGLDLNLVFEGVDIPPSLLVFAEYPAKAQAFVITLHGEDCSNRKRYIYGLKSDRNKEIIARYIANKTETPAFIKEIIKRIENL